MSPGSWWHCSVMNHFNCKILTVLKLVCADISINVISMGVANVSFLGVRVLFVFTLTTILRIPSAEGRRKAFSTCSAHLTVVIVFYGTILFMYGKPKSKDPLGADKQDLADKLTFLFYGVLTAERTFIFKKHFTQWWWQGPLWLPRTEKKG
uniref:olfactory receptor 13C7-like n=1 Tax=Myodes glareolus TaxID=447135 RepID=UPI00202110CE|nr:olfactory receptor 13C7-like [Myodes glareolus]